MRSQARWILLMPRRHKAIQTQRPMRSKKHPLAHSFVGCLLRHQSTKTHFSSPLAEFTTRALTIYTAKQLEDISKNVRLSRGITIYERLATKTSMQWLNDFPRFWKDPLIAKFPTSTSSICRHAVWFLKKVWGPAFLIFFQKPFKSR